MNRLVMGEEIAMRVPTLAQGYKEDWKHVESLRRGFVGDYPVGKISALTLDEYVIGKGADNRSFCYRLERETDALGRILGATAFKFGVYYGRTKGDASERYRFASQWGSGLQEAFASVKRAIVDLLQAAKKGDVQTVDSNHLSRMIKGKLLFLYYPEEFAPIYSRNHLEHFVARLDLSGPFKSGAEMQRALMKYRARWPQLRRQPVPLYMRLLYDLFDYPRNAGHVTGGSSTTEPLLDEAVTGAQFISQMPPLPHKASRASGIHGTIDFSKRDSQLRRIGDRGEAVVLAMEKRRLNRAGKRALAARIDQVSNKDASAGFDILSFDENGRKRPIEVKATCDANLARGFYISKNELDKSATLENYYLYIVFSAMSKKPRVLPISKPALRGGPYTLQPLNYRVTLY